MRAAEGVGIGGTFARMPSVAPSTFCVSPWSRFGGGPGLNTRLSAAPHFSPLDQRICDDRVGPRRKATRRHVAGAGGVCSRTTPGGPQWSASESCVLAWRQAGGRR